MVCNTIPFLADYRLVVVEGLFERFEAVRARKPRKGASKDDGPLGEWSGLVDLVRALPPTTTLVLISGKIGPANVLLKALQGQGVARIEPLFGDEFDPNRHEAIMRQPSDEAAPNTIVSVLSPGYTLGDLVLRPAKVAVAAAEEG